MVKDSLRIRFGGRNRWCAKDRHSWLHKRKAGQKRQNFRLFGQKFSWNLL